MLNGERKSQILQTDKDWLDTAANDQIVPLYENNLSPSFSLLILFKMCNCIVMLNLYCPDGF